MLVRLQTNIGGGGLDVSKPASYEEYFTVSSANKTITFDSPPKCIELIAIFTVSPNNYRDFMIGDYETVNFTRYTDGSLTRKANMGWAVETILSNVYTVSSSSITIKNVSGSSRTYFIRIFY